MKLNSQEATKVGWKGDKSRQVGNTLKIFPGMSVMPGRDELDESKVVSASKYPQGPRNVPEQPAAVIKKQPQA